jgi:excisionase family DNA binding protein
MVRLPEPPACRAVVSFGLLPPHRLHAADSGIDSECDSDFGITGPVSPACRSVRQGHAVRVWRFPAMTGEKTLPNCTLLTADEVAERLRTSRRTIDRLHAAGKLPRPVRPSRSNLWRGSEIAEWIDAGCPRREQWERTRKKTVR